MHRRHAQRVEDGKTESLTKLNIIVASLSLPVDAPMVQIWRSLVICREVDLWPNPNLWPHLDLNLSEIFTRCFSGIYLKVLHRLILEFTSLGVHDACSPPGRLTDTELNCHEWKIINVLHLSSSRRVMASHRELESLRRSSKSSRSSTR